ncbi:MAG: hypothetical protein AAF682_27710 [Planctomycetota bacterium]
MQSAQSDRRFSSVLLSLALLVPGLAAGPQQVDSAADLAKLLDAGETEDALERAALALEYTPGDGLLFDVAARACAALDRNDEAYWYASVGLGLVDNSKQGKIAAKHMAELVASLRPTETVPDDLLEEYTETLFKLAQTCQRKKLYANAVDLLARCRGTRFEERAQEQLDKMFSNEKVVQALLASGIDIPAKPATKKSPEWIAREDAKHADWDDAYEIKGNYYTIITNMGYEMAQSMALAMEQMNAFYRRVFRYKERGGTMRRCVIKVYGNRDLFDLHEDMGDKPTTKGFFVPLENRVATYDPRSEGAPLTSLWSTLFHEASHQFTRAVSTELLPAWLNEGTASYFEGATLLPSGFVETNQIPANRLRNLLALLETGRPSVKTVVSYYQPGSYPGEYYPFGWGLAYFIQNYENERSERVYLPIYQDYLGSYKSGGKHNPFDRFVDYFVDKAKQPGIETFDDFVAHWKAWIQDLGAIYNGGAEQADVLVERARKQRADDKPAYAAESYRWALQKRDDARTSFELGETLAELEHDDGAMQSFRHALALVRAEEDPSTPVAGFDGQSAADVAEECLVRITKVNRNIGDGLRKADAGLTTAVAEVAEGFVDAGFPRSSVQLLDTSAAVLGGSGPLREMRLKIQDEHELDVRRWRRLRVDDELALWQGGGDWGGEDGDVRVDTDALVTTTYREDVPASYRYEARIYPGDEGDTPVFGIVFGSNNRTGMRMFGVLPGPGIAALVELKEGPEIVDQIGRVPEIGGEGLLLALEVSPESVTFFMQGEKVKELPLTPAEVAGRIGLFAQDTSATFADVRIRY